MGDVSPAAKVLEALQGSVSKPVDWDAIEARRRAERAGYGDRIAAAQKAWDEAAQEGVVSRVWRRAALRTMNPMVRFDDCKRIERGALGDWRSLIGAQRWLEGNKPILLLLGTSGAGKSLAAHAAGVEWARGQAERLARYHRSDAYNPLKVRLRHYAGDVSRWCGKKGAAVVDARILPETFDPWRDERDGKPLLRWGHPFLVIDDLGTESKTDRWENAFGRLLDQRLRRNPKHCRTVITSNLGRGDIRPRYLDRVARRLSENAIVIEMKEADVQPPRGAGL